jgi:hypothetical protein
MQACGNLLRSLQLSALRWLEESSKWSVLGCRQFRCCYAACNRPEISVCVKTPRPECLRSVVGWHCDSWWGAGKTGHIAWLCTPLPGSHMLLVQASAEQLLPAAVPCWTSCTCKCKRAPPLKAPVMHHAAESRLRIPLIMASAGSTTCVYACVCPCTAHASCASVQE